MSKETELLRRAAKELSRDAESEELDDYPEGSAVLRADAASLLALADQMERAVPVGWLESPSKTFARNHAYKMTAPQATSWRIPLYTHPAPEVTRDAERYRWLRDGNATERGEPWAITRYAPGDERNRDGGTCPLAGDELDAAIDAAMQEPKP